MRQGFRRKAVAAALAVSVATAGAVMTSSGAQAKPGNGQANGLEQTNGNEKALYVVQMLDLPVVAYDGSIKGYPATKAKAGWTATSVIVVLLPHEQFAQFLGR